MFYQFAQSATKKQTLKLNNLHTPSTRRLTKITQTSNGYKLAEAVLHLDIVDTNLNI